MTSVTRLNEEKTTRAFLIIMALTFLVAIIVSFFDRKPEDTPRAQVAGTQIIITPSFPVPDSHPK